MTSRRKKLADEGEVDARLVKDAISTFELDTDRPVAWAPQATPSVHAVAERSTLRNPDQKSIKDIAVELGVLGQKARDKKLSPKDLQGANFTISSLGAIGGTAFTPLVNWPQVAILGISPATMQPVWNGQGFDPKLMLPR